MIRDYHFAASAEEISARATIRLCGAHSDVRYSGRSRCPIARCAIIGQTSPRDHAKSNRHKSGHQEALVVGDTSGGCLAGCRSTWDRMDRSADWVGPLFTYGEEAPGRRRKEIEKARIPVRACGTLVLDNPRVQLECVECKIMRVFPER